jgi:hypothetical protein
LRRFLIMELSGTYLNLDGEILNSDKSERELKEGEREFAMYINNRLSKGEKIEVFAVFFGVGSKYFW